MEQRMSAEPSYADAVKVCLPPRDSLEPAYAKSNVPVFFACDGEFFPHAMTAVASIMEHASPDNNYDIVVVQSGIPRERMLRAVDWLARYPNASLRFVEISVMFAMAEGERFPVKGRFSHAAYYRLFAPKIFERYDRIVYYDADVVVRCDVADFYRQGLEGRLAAGCHDFATEEQVQVRTDLSTRWRGSLKKEPGEPYFLTGCLVMDLAGMRRDNSQDAFLAKIPEVAESEFPYQDAMNAALKDQLRYLGCEWNFLDWMEDPFEESRNYRYISEDSLKLVRQARGHYKVLHYADRKPWTTEYMGKNDSLYWKYAAQGPFFDEIAAALAAQVSPPVFALKYLSLAFQTLHFIVKNLISRSGDREKYENRLFNLKRRRKGLVKQFKRALSLKMAKRGRNAGPMGKTGGVDGR